MSTPAGASASRSGATIRVDDVAELLSTASYAVTHVRADRLPAPTAQPWDVGVVVSYAAIGALRLVGDCARFTWLDAVDSWLLVNGSGLRARRLSYAARAVRDAVRIARAPAADVVTYISQADLLADRSTVRGRRRLVMPGASSTAVAVPAVEGIRRLVLAADWRYAPNADGLAWFVARVLPRVRLAPGWTVHVFGAGAPVLPGATVHGYVDDESQLYRAGDVHVAPVAHGAGVKRKVVAPLLAGLPVVTTVAGAHGLRPHERLRVQREPDAFAAAIERSMSEEPSVQPLRESDVFDADDRDALLGLLLLPTTPSTS